MKQKFHTGLCDALRLFIPSEMRLGKVKELIKNHPDVKEYNALATQVNESTFIKEKEETLKKMQKELVYLTNDNKNKEYEELKVKDQQLKKEFDEYPLHSNYLQAKEKVNDLLTQVSEMLSSL